MLDDRPDPDQLLAQLRQQEERASRGKLRIYFGSSAGVGKTYAMLLAARKLKADGIDVVAGVVETHGRSETAALLDGLELLPAAAIAYRGKSLPEFDLDGALKRRPGLLLVDELAHSNVPGSRHPKRWQDVDELLDAGIDVYTTVNVQHLESLNDVVGGITGVRVQETLPDTFFDSADEVLLVDTPADELLARLAGGKVYLPAQAERAAKNFFRKGNLMALRELALRRTADRVEDDVQAWRSDQAIERVWKTGDGILCCIGPESGARVVRSAARLAQQLSVDWQAVYIETPALQRLPAAQREQVLQTVRLAEELGAKSAVLTGQNVAEGLTAYAREHNLSRIVIGRHASNAPGWLRRWRGGPLGLAIARLAPDVDLLEIGTGEQSDAAPRRTLAEDDESHEGGRLPWRYLGSLAACVGTTLVALLLQRYFDLANIVMVFLLAVVGVAVRFGRGPAVAAAFLSVGAFDFFFVSPRFSFAVTDVQYLLTFAVMLVVALVTGQLTAGLRFQARVATHRETRSRALFEVARDLSGVLMAEQVAELAERVIGREFRGRARLFLLDRDDRLMLAPSADGGSIPELATAQWVADRAEPAGLGTGTLPGSAWLYLPLKAAMRTRGVLALEPSSPRLLLVPEQRQQLETFAALVATALERVHYVEVAQEATVHIESERLRNSLLSALSHDLRTPLAALYGLADTLLASTEPLPAPAADLARAIRDETRRMNAMVNNLLDMARLQSGTVQLNLQWQPIEEVVGSALQAMRSVLARHIVQTQLAADLPLLQFDAVLIERVLCNLLENAAKYTPAGSIVSIGAGLRGGELAVTVADNGPGLPPGREEALFEKFARGLQESATPGVGLGLSICRAIVEAHHGHIGVERGAGGRGAVFRFTLPLGEPPLMPALEEVEAGA